MRFVAGTHKYYLGKQELRGVTKWISSFFTEFDEKEVAKKLTYIYRNKGIKKGVREIKKEWRAKRDEGSLVHKEIERWIKDVTFVPTHPKARLATELLDKWIKEGIGGSKIQWFKPEFIVFSKRNKLAGTIDLLISTDDGYIIVDWKTNTAIKKTGFTKSTHPVTLGLDDCNYNHYALQLTTYGRLLEDMGFDLAYDANSLKLVHLYSDKDYNIININRYQYINDKEQCYETIVEDMISYDKKQETKGKQKQKKSN